MTIQDALERAKAMQKARRREAEREASREGLDRPARGGNAMASDSRGGLADARTVINPAAKKVAEQRLPEIPDIPYAYAACIDNRILIPEAMTLKSSAPAMTAYRMMRTRILQRARAQQWQAVAITSPGPGEGKSVTALNLALTIAREKTCSVFLLDMDFRNPSVCRYLGLTPPRQLTDYFAQQATAEQVMFKVGVENFVMAGNTESSPQSSELIATGRLTQLLSAIRSWSSDALVIIDLPPVLSTDEALQTAPVVSATFLVVAEGKTRRDGVVKALDLLKDYNVAGVILNQADDVVADYYAG